MNTSDSSPVTGIRVRNVSERYEYREDSFSFFSFLTGKAGITAGGAEADYRRGGFLFLPPGHPALIVPDPEVSFLAVTLSRDFVEDNLNRISLPVCSSELDASWNCRNLQSLVLSLPGSPEDDPGKLQLTSTGTAYLILAELLELPLYSPWAETGSRFGERTRAIADYISLHYSEPLTLTGLANIFYLTPQYLSTFFRKNFNTNFKSYLIERRLFYSLRDLRNTHLTISEIALKNGFSSISAYRRNFQNMYRISPSDFRTAYLRGRGGGREEEARPSAASPDMRFLRRTAEGDASGPAVRRPSVQKMINIGSARNLLSERFRSELASFSADNGIRYIRVLGMMSNSFIPKVLPRYEYYFRSVDTALTFFYSNGLTPFLELTRLPLLLSMNSEEGAPYIPRGDRFIRLLKSFLQHVTRRWPANWLSGWKFELWMHPKDTAASYMSSFAEIRSLIKSFIPGAAVGGPGYLEGFTPADAGTFCEALEKKRLGMDFFSLYLNCGTYSRSLDRAVISLREDFPEETARKIREQLRAAGQTIPLYVTEWTSVAFTRSPVTSSRFQAAFIAKMWTRLDSVCDLAGYWLFCGHGEEDLSYAGEGEQRTGGAPQAPRRLPPIFGNGLMNSNFLPYAPYYAFLLCASLSEETVSEGDCFRLVKSGSGHYQLLAWHYEHFLSGTGAGSMGPMEFDQVYSLFRESPPLELDLAFSGIESGLYHISKVTLGEFSGSFLDILIGEFTHSSIDRVDFLQNIRTLPGYGNTFRLRACVPEERCTYTSVTDSLRITASLPAHTVCLWDIRRQA